MALDVQVCSRFGSRSYPRLLHPHVTSGLFLCLFSIVSASICTCYLQYFGHLCTIYTLKGHVGSHLVQLAESTTTMYRRLGEGKNERKLKAGASTLSCHMDYQLVHHHAHASPKIPPHESQRKRPSYDVCHCPSLCLCRRFPPK